MVEISPESLERLPAFELVHWAIEQFGANLALVTSFQDEGMVLVDMAASISPSIRVVTLDTGRLPAETFQAMEAVRKRYRVAIEVVSPDASQAESMVTRHGPNLFYEDYTLRLLCCQVRKVLPLERKLAGFSAQMVGLRRDQSETRADVAKAVMEKGRWKLSPLADWTREQVRTYLTEHNVPRHPLYSQGYTSIGCGPCTRAVTEGEDERAGRWWWEQGPKECGLHFSPEGRAERKLDVLLREITNA